MKTKFILHGGFTPGKKQANDSFTREILNNAPHQVKILLVYFAKEADRISVNQDEDVTQFNKHKGDRILLFEVADEKLFSKQVKEADIIYLHGGSSLKLLNALKQFSDLKQLFEGKIIAGDSAGANVLSAAFYSLTADTVFDGLGLLPFKIICHYSKKYREGRVRLERSAPNTQTLSMPEYKYQVFYSEQKTNL